MNKHDYCRKKNKFLKPIYEWVQANSPGSAIIPYCGAYEEELQDMETEEDREKQLKEDGVTSAMPKMISTAFHMVHLINFFTAGPDEVKAWTVRKGFKAPQAAGVIHTDFEKGFIMAEVMSFTDLKELGSEANCQAAGKYRQEGKNYEARKTPADGNARLLADSLAQGLGCGVCQQLMKSLWEDLARPTATNLREVISKGCPFLVKKHLLRQGWAASSDHPPQRLQPANGPVRSNGLEAAEGLSQSPKRPKRELPGAMPIAEAFDVEPNEDEQTPTSPTSWRCLRCSQIGLLAGFTTPSVKMQPTKYTVIDWRSCRAPRVCRSTLAAEACAADEASDRASYLNRMASELHFNEPAHRVGARMAMAQAIDAKSLYDALLADAPNISDRRSLVSVRSVQEVMRPDQVHWIPTNYEFADGLTKVDEKLMYMFRAWLESPMAVLVEHPENASILARAITSVAGQVEQGWLVTLNLLQWLGSVDLLKIEKDDEDDDLISAVDKKSMFYFVESWWFHLLAALVICCNTVSIVLEADSKLSEKLLAKLFWVDQCSLIFYVLELFCRACFWKKRLLCGTRSLAMWSLIDIIVVGAGVLDQWLFRYLAPYLPMSAESAQNILGIIRLMRLVRVIKLLALMLDWDLSWTEGAGFQSFIGGVIAVNALLMGCETDIDWGGWLVFENFLLCIYVFELVVRLKRLGREFFSCDSPDIVWNLLDLAIVVSSAGDSWLAHGVNVGQLMMLMRLLRLLRILRLAKLVKSVRPLYILVVSVTAAVQGVVWVLVLTVVTLYAMGILTTRLIGHKMIFNADQDRAGRGRSTHLAFQDRP
eukprot:g32902.t1